MRWKLEKKRIFPYIQICRGYFLVFLLCVWPHFLDCFPTLMSFLLSSINVNVNLMISPLVSCLPLLFSRACWQITAENRAREADGGGGRLQPLPGLSVLLLLIHPFIYPPSPNNRHPFSSSPSFLISEGIILTCHSKVHDVLIYCQVALARPDCGWNKSQRFGDETAGCVSFSACGERAFALRGSRQGSPLSRHANNTSTTENGVVCTLLTIHSRPRGLIMHHARGFIKRAENKDGRNER